MKTHSTQFRIQVVLHGDTPPEVLTVLEFLKQNRINRKALSTPTPNHPFFMTRGWCDIFHGCSVRLTKGPKFTHILKVHGRTALEEQDIGLFLRWLLPNVVPTGRRPKRVATVRSSARVQLTCLSYFVRDGELSVCYVDSTFSNITNYQAAA